MTTFIQYINTNICERVINDYKHKRDYKLPPVGLHQFS